MKEVKLRMKEMEKYKIIKELVDHNGNKLRAKERLGLSMRQIDRLIKIYKENEKIFNYFFEKYTIYFRRSIPFMDFFWIL